MQFQAEDPGSPFFYKQGNVGCLLIHGFTGYPEEMRGLGQYLAQKGITALGVKLPGHGTKPEDLAGVTWLDWINEVHQTYTQLTQICDKVFVAGFSMGGTLALHLASHAPVAGVISMSAPVDRSSYKDPRIYLLPVWQ